MTSRWARRRPCSSSRPATGLRPPRAEAWGDVDQRAWAAAYPDRAREEDDRVNEPVRLTIKWIDDSVRRTRRWYDAKRVALRRIAEAALEHGISLHEMHGYGAAYDAAVAEEETAERQAMLDHRDEVRHSPDEIERARQRRANYGAWGRRKVKGNTWLRRTDEQA